MHTIIFGKLVLLPVQMTAVHALIHALLFGVTGFLSGVAVHFGNYRSLPVFQKIINYATLYVLGTLLCLGGGYLLTGFILGNEKAALFVPLIPALAFIALLFFVILLLHDALLPLRQTGGELVEKENERKTDAEPDENREEQPAEALERIVVRVGQKIHVILLPDILYLQSDGDYVQIHTPKGRYLKEQTMKYFELHLPVRLFVRVHRSFIVNVEHISRIELFEKQNQLILLKDGQRIKMSVAGYKALRSALGL
ncbi:MAG: LytTR family transcriptional regulator DNA-binding domain-containing protein [Prevotellaceae bacterium]|nr:LytTR family transcriptional regulator DNA-binding domain-containing protein [Prevotellaceae bacterium]